MNGLIRCCTVRNCVQLLPATTNDPGMASGLVLGTAVASAMRTSPSRTVTALWRARLLAPDQVQADPSGLREEPCVRKHPDRPASACFVVHCLGVGLDRLASNPKGIGSFA